MKDFCPEDEGFLPIWSEGGFSHCFLYTLNAAVFLAYVVLFGIYQYWKEYVPAKKKLIEKTHHLTKEQKKKALQAPKQPDSVLNEVFYSFARSIALFLCLLGFFQIGIHFHHSILYGYLLTAEVLTVTSWLLIYVLLVLNNRINLLLVKSLFFNILFFLFFVDVNLKFTSLHSPRWWRLDNMYHISEFVIFVLRYTSSITFLVFLTLSILKRREKLKLKAMRKTNPVEFAPLLGSESEDFTESASKIAQKEKAKPSTPTTTSPDGEENPLLYYFGQIKRLKPFLWPSGEPCLQLRVIICISMLGIARVVNLFVPLYYKELVEDLDGAHSIPWKSMLLYLLFRFFQGGDGSGIVSNLRSFIWIPVNQHSLRLVRVQLFEHLHSLSLSWHLGRKTGEVLRVMDRGTESINSLLSILLFNILPTIADVSIAIVYFIIYFDIYFGIIVFATMASYIYFTVQVTEWRNDFRRDMNAKDNESRQKGTDSLLNFETVKYYGREKFEVDRFNQTILDYQESEWKTLASLNLLNTGQNLLITFGLTCGTLLCGYRVAQGELSVGDFVLFVSYMGQLYAPLNYFGAYYRAIQQNFIDMENMFELLDVAPTIVDLPGAPQIKVGSGEVVFENVSFSYHPERPVLKNVSFTIPPGKTFALVGSSGGGKSTIIRLLYRFYDVQSGRILIDGQDITRVTQSSLRNSIGVVPQDTVLFHDNIQYNIRYGKITASDKEVEEAATAAEIHDRILTFPDGYKTIVGERGLRLSGGEKQRVAIARTILKDPNIVLLDEATSALDTETERNIQQSLAKICANRTTLVVAHRLSTIINADQILVMKDGQIVERGTHSDLLQLQKVYFEMWMRQLETNDDIKSKIKDTTK